MVFPVQGSVGLTGLRRDEEALLKVIGIHDAMGDSTPESQRKNSKEHYLPTQPFAASTFGRAPVQMQYSTRLHLLSRNYAQPH